MQMSKKNNIMKAKLLVDYSEVKKGTEFEVVEIVGTRCTLLIEGRNVDFGISEVEIIANTRTEMFEAGRYIQGMFSAFAMRNTEVEMQIKKLKFPMSKKMICKCVNTFLYN